MQNIGITNQDEDPINTSLIQYGKQKFNNLYEDAKQRQNRQEKIYSV